MTSLIILQGNSLDGFYDQALDYLHTKYHTHPPYSANVHVNERMISEMGYYEGMAQDMADQNHYAQDIPLGKLVI
jgi:hypothetical protein